jgi:hypothetical protein
MKKLVESPLLESCISIELLLLTVTVRNVATGLSIFMDTVRLPYWVIYWSDFVSTFTDWFRQGNVLFFNKIRSPGIVFEVDNVGMLEDIYLNVR